MPYFLAVFVLGPFSFLMFLELHYIVDVWKNEDVLIEENICSSELNCDKLLNSLTDDGT